MPGSVSIGIQGGAATFQRVLGPNSAFARSCSAVAAKAVKADLTATAEDARLRSEAYITSHYQTRPAGRKNADISQVPLAGSMRGVVRQGRQGGFPMTIELYSEADPRKVNALNSGAKAHTITARNAPFLLFPATGLGRSGPSNLTRPLGSRVGTAKVGRNARFRPSSFAGAQASNSGPMVRKQSVQHPGIKPSYFMENALEQAVRARLNKSVSIPRR